MWLVGGFECFVVEIVLLGGQGPLAPNAVDLEWLARSSRHKP
jgi:hypothetical protein